MQSKSALHFFSVLVCLLSVSCHVQDFKKQLAKKTLRKVCVSTKKIPNHNKNSSQFREKKNVFAGKPLVINLILKRTVKHLQKADIFHETATFEASTSFTV